MAGATAWRGAIGLAGQTVNVALYTRVMGSATSFKSIDPVDHKPIHQVKISEAEYEKLAADPQERVLTLGTNDLLKGVDTGAGFAPVPKAAVTALADLEKTRVTDEGVWVRASELPFELAKSAYVVIPDEKVPGSEIDAQQLYDGLRASGLAYVTVIGTRAGSRDRIVAFYADADGFWGLGLPFAHELKATPEYAWEYDKAAGKRMGDMLSELVVPFDHEAFKSNHERLRQAAEDAALEGKPMPKPKAAPKKAASDLMAALEGAVKAEKPKPKAKPRKKVSA